MPEPGQQQGISRSHAPRISTPDCGPETKAFGAGGTSSAIAKAASRLAATTTPSAMDRVGGSAQMRSQPTGRGVEA
jgi:hypothetical protein